jgi:hypothetical protein
MPTPINPFTAPAVTRLSATPARINGDDNTSKA